MGFWIIDVRDGFGWRRPGGRLVTKNHYVILSGFRILGLVAMHRLGDGAVPRIIALRIAAATVV